MKIRMAMAALLLIGSTSCGNELRDVPRENIEVTGDTRWEVHQAPNLFPNIAVACIEGHLVAITTREAAPVVLGPCEQVPG